MMCAAFFGTTEAVSPVVLLLRLMALSINEALAGGRDLSGSSHLKLVGYSCLGTP